MWKNRAEHEYVRGSSSHQEKTQQLHNEPVPTVEGYIYFNENLVLKINRHYTATILIKV